MKVVSVDNMRISDAYTIANLVPGLELMYRAALGIFRAVSWNGRIAIVTGSGNNGGDGFALACILQERGYSCTVYKVAERISADSAHYANMAAQAQVPVCTYRVGCLKGYNMIVDCLLGTGFQGVVRGNYRTAIEEINASDAYVVSADINSGMNGDTVEAELAVRSDLTVTIGFVKTGLITKRAGTYIKRLVCTDIGIVLVRDEGDISPEEAPSWLDWDIIDAQK